MSKNIIIAFGGLGSIWGKEAIEIDLIEKLGADYKIFDYDEIEDAKNFVDTYEDHTVSLVAGHSLGGETAIRFAEWMAKRHQSPILVTIDPRWNTKKLAMTFDWIFNGFKSLDFTAPRLIRSFNFYQKKWPQLPGYLVKGATNEKLTGKGHLRLCSHKRIISVVKQLLGN